MADKSAQASEERFKQFSRRDADLMRWRYGRGYIAEWEADRYRRMFRGGKRILDVGCGAGEAAIWADGIEYVGIDMAEAQLRQGCGKPDRLLAAASVLALPFPDGCFDRVVAVGVFHHMTADEIPAALREMARVLAPDGQIASIEPNPWNLYQRLLAYLRPAERGILHTSLPQLRRVVESVPEVAVEHLGHDHIPFWPGILTFLLRRWSWPTGPRMTRLFRAWQGVMIHLLPKPFYSTTAFRLRKAGGPPNMTESDRNTLKVALSC